MINEFIELTNGMDGTPMFLQPKIINGWFLIEKKVHVIVAGDTCIQVKETAVEVKEKIKAVAPVKEDDQ
jgi:hypothetical protein